MKRNCLNVQMKIAIGLAIVMVGILTISCNKKKTAGPPSCCQKEHTVAKQSSSQRDESLYQLTGFWVDQHNQKVELRQLQGKWQIVAMIFTSCGYACPRIVDNMQAIENKLPPEIKKQVSFLLVSFDEKKDTPERLLGYAVNHRLDSTWTLLHGNAAQVRMLSMMLNVKYDLLPGGSFNHSNVITLLNEEGMVAKRFEGLDLNAENTTREIEALVGGKP